MKIKRKLTIGILLIPTMFLIFFTFIGYLMLSNYLMRVNEDEIKTIATIEGENINYVCEDLVDDLIIYINNIHHPNNIIEELKHENLTKYIGNLIVEDENRGTIFNGKINDYNELKKLKIGYQSATIKNYDNNYFMVSFKYTGDKQSGILSILINKSFFDKYLSNIEFGKTVYAYIIDSNGIILRHPDLSKIGTKVSNNFVNSLIKDNAENKESFIKSGLYNYDNKERFSAVKYIDKFELFYIITQNVKEIKFAAYTSSTAILIFGLLIIILSLFIGRHYLKSITKPLDRLTKILDETDITNIGHVEFDDKEDEISKLYNVYNDLTVRLSDSYNEMESLYEEIYAQDEELRVQYDELKQSEEKTRELYEHLRELFNNSPDAIVQFDKNQYIVNVNPAFEKLFGYSIKECIGKNVDEIVIPLEFKELAIEATKTLFSNGQVTLEGIRYNKNGDEIYVHIKGLLIKINDELVGGYAIYTDFSENKKYQERLEYLSLHDALTSVYNLAFFQEELKRYSNGREFPITIIMADLNGLKLVNDTLGHSYGDKLIIGCAEALKKSLRSCDIIARTGGDEFAIILPNTDNIVAEEILKRIKKNIEKFNIASKNEGIVLSVSFGYATSMESKNLKETLKEADEAMYKNKLLDNYSLRRQTLNVLMATLAEKDYVTKGHTDRVKHLCQRLGEALNISQKQMADLLLLAEVHDLGKVAIPDSILFKPDKLTEEEWKIMKQHPEKGYRIALSSPDLSNVAELILKHHERCDGKGYPLGLKKDDIPIECRILAVVDAYDAMTNSRPYNKVKTKEDALAELMNCRGNQFDVDVVDAFLSLIAA